MQTQITAFFAIMLTAIAAENMVFTRALGLNRRVLSLNSARDSLIYGAFFTWITFFTVFPSYLVRRLVEDMANARIIRALLFLASVILIYLGTHFLLQRTLPNFYNKYRRALPVNAFNTALFGTLYISLNQNLTLPGSIAYALGAGIGYTLAILLLHAAKRRLSFSAVPKSFRGMPILMVYIGILSLALYGLLGYGLAS